MLIIFPLDDVVCDVTQTYRTFAETHASDIGLLQPKISTLPAGGDTAFWRKLVMAYIDDHLNTVLNWATSTNQFNALLEEMFPGYGIDNKPLVSSNTLRENYMRRLTQKQKEYATLHRQYGAMFFLEISGNLEHHKTDRQRRLAWAIAKNRMSSCVNQIACLNQLLSNMASKTDVVDVAALESITENFYTDVLSPVQENIHQWIEAMLGEDNDAAWKIWHTRTMGTDILMESGIDYRIYDWERRTQSGEWKHNEASHTDS